MDTIEIFLSKIKDADELYLELSQKLGRDIPEGGISELAFALSEYSEPVHFSVYVSDENIENGSLSDISDCFRKAAGENSNISLDISEDEFLHLIDSADRITNICKPRKLVHRDGDLHPTVHVWTVRNMDMGIYVLLQKRAGVKETNPDCYDCSVAGHVGQGDEFRDAAVRELFEEIGLDAAHDELEFIGTIRNLPDASVNAGSGKDNELSAVYLYREDVDTDKLVLLESEVAEVCWAELDELLSVLDKDDFNHCIFAEELQMIKKAVY